MSAARPAATSARPAVAVSSDQRSPRFLDSRTPSRGGSKKIQQAVVVVVHELSDPHAGRHVHAGTLAEAALAVTHQEDAGGVGAAEQKIRVAIFVDVGCGQRAV